MTTRDPPTKRLQILDWIVAGMVLPSTLFLAMMPVTVSPHFLHMFEAFGSVLPIITQMALSPTFCWGISAAIWLMVVGALAVVPTMRHRMMIYGVAWLTGTAAIVLFFWGLYAPIFYMSGSV